MTKHALMFAVAALVSTLGLANAPRDAGQDTALSRIQQSRPRPEPLPKPEPTTPAEPKPPAPGPTNTGYPPASPP